MKTPKKPSAPKPLRMWIAKWSHVRRPCPIGLDVSYTRRDAWKKLLQFFPRLKDRHAAYRRGIRVVAVDIIPRKP